MDAFIATTAVTNAGLSARAARLYAFMQENRNFQTDIFMWRKAKTCAALGISEATYARAIRELREKELVRETVRFSEITKRQLVSYYHVCHTGHALSVESEAVRSLSHSTFSVYMEIARCCGKESWAVSRRSLAKKTEAVHADDHPRRAGAGDQRLYQHEVGKPSPYLRQSRPDLQPVPPPLLAGTIHAPHALYGLLPVHTRYFYLRHGLARFFPDYPPRQI